MKKRVLFCIDEFSQNSIGISLTNLLSKIDLSKFDVDLLYMKANSEILRRVPKQINVVNDKFNFSKLNFINIIKFYHRYDFSIMYDFGNTSLGDLVRASSKNNAIYIHKDLNNIYPVKDKYDEFLIKNKISKYNKIICSNSFIYDDMLVKCSDLKDKFHQLEYIVDDIIIDKLSKESVELSKPDNKKLFLLMGSLSDRSKNYTTLIKMFSDLVKINNQVYLWIMGDSSELINIKMLIEKYGISSYVSIIGFKNNPYPYMKLSDYIINLSDSYDSQLTVLEAQVLNKPVISIIDIYNCDNNYVVSNDYEKMAEEINSIINSKKYNVSNNNFWALNQKTIKKFESLI